MSILLNAPMLHVQKFEDTVEFINIVKKLKEKKNNHLYSRLVDPKTLSTCWIFWRKMARSYFSVTK